MTKEIENLINLLATKSINYHDFISISTNIDKITSLFDPKDLSMWKFLGVEIVKLDNGKITLKSRETDINDEKFCVVDIETNGSLISGQIIEIGAVKLQNGEITDKFQTFVKADFIPENISELTGITLNDLKNAPNIAYVLEQFRLFLGSDIFVAHNVKFDYNFISASLERLGFGMLLNRQICTIELAKRTIPSVKYGLSSLKDLLGIKCVHHRALSDAIAAAEIFNYSLKMLPWSVQSTEDLINFSKTAKPLILPKSKII